MQTSTKLIRATSIEQITPLLKSEGISIASIALIDSKVEELYGEFFPFTKIVVSGGEEIKTFKEVERVTKELLRLGADRSTTIVAIGGGSVTDLTGFVASIYFRGIDYINIPTTLIGMIDAAIGGKCAINLDNHKNSVGSFYLPHLTVLSPFFLKTLPKEQILSGVAELLKTFIIADRAKFHSAVEFFSSLLSLPRELNNEELKRLTQQIYSAVEIKKRIVKRDPYDKGERKLLNLGHTFGHAIERELKLEHGVAVAIGITVAAKISVKLSLMTDSELTILEHSFKKVGLPTELPLKAERLLSILLSDKKREGDLLTLVAIKKIGEATLYPISIIEFEKIIYDLS